MLWECTVEEALKRYDWAKRWPNFSPRELASNGNGKVQIHLPSLDALQAMRTESGLAFNVSSAYRDPHYNATMRPRGSKRSRHMSGAAYDITCSRTSKLRKYLVANYEKHGFNAIGLYGSFVHLDFRARPAKWGY